MLFHKQPGGIAFNSQVAVKTIQNRSRPSFCKRMPSATWGRKPRVSTSILMTADTPQQDDKPNTTSNLAKRALSNLLAGFEPTPELSAILLVYFVQGALGISRLAISFFLKDNLGLSPSEAAALTGATMLPWLIKPLYGFMSDTVPIFGYRRRSYLIGAGAIGVGAWLSLATYVNSSLTALLATIAASLSVAVSDVVVDSLVVERVRGLPTERSGALQSLCWGSAAFGGLISAYFSGSLLQTLTPQTIFGATALLPLGTGLLAGLIKEERVPTLKLPDLVPVVKSRVQSLRSALSNPSVYLPVAFVFAWQATPSPDSALFYFSTNELGFGPEFLGRVRLASSAAALFGLWMYRKYLREVPLPKLFRWLTIISVPLSLTQVLLVTRANVVLGISDKAFALTDTAVLTALGQVAFMPTLVLAAKLCPPGVEGTLFAALMSIYNTSGATSNELGALLTSALGVTETNFSNLWLLVTICSLSNLLALPLIPLVAKAPADVPEKHEDEIGAESKNGAEFANQSSVPLGAAFSQDLPVGREPDEEC